MSVKAKTTKNAQSDSALVVGAGMGGIRAALDLAEAGHMVTLVDQQPNIGGVVMQLDRQFPTNDCGICKMLPTMMRDDISECCMRRNLSHPNIKIYTSSTVKKVSGEAGNFSIDILRKPQYVDSIKCISCGKCEEVCPIEVPNEFNDDLSSRKAIFTTYPLPNPNVYTLDMENCTKCGKCVEICPTDAVDLKAKEQEISISAGAIILAPGLQIFDPEPYKAYGYGTDPNILTSIDLERIYSGLGPYSGERKLVRPSDKQSPKNLAFIQCVGSRNTQFGHEYCSYACCMYSLKEAMLIKEQNPEIEVTIYFMDMRAFGKNYHEYYLQAQDMGVNFMRCRVPAVVPVPDSDDLELTLVTEAGEVSKQDFELVVLAVGLEAPEGAKNLGEIFGIKLDENNFSTQDEFTPVSSSRAGIYVCGAFTGPKDIPETVTEASAAVAMAEQHLMKPKQDIASEKSTEPETDAEADEPAIGIILCSCGDEITSKIDFNKLEEYAKGLDAVELVENIDYLCLKPEEIKNLFKRSEKKVNKLIIGACVPYEFEIMFKEHARAVGIDPVNLEIINLRERLAWSCAEDRVLSTAMAKGQLAITYERLVGQDKVSTEISLAPVTKRALIVGGGITGMTSAITLAENNFEVDLVENTDSLGGNLKDIYSTLEHEDTQKLLKAMISRIKEKDNISLYLNTKVDGVSGYVGNFQATLTSADKKGEPTNAEYGAIILATGAKQYEPSEYLYGSNSQVITQLELEERLANNKITDAKNIVMIQCVGSRNNEHPYCSRVCCAKAIKNALKIRSRSPKTRVYIIYQDIMTYGLQEKYFLQARDAGIEFLRYEPEVPPTVTKGKKKDGLQVRLKDILLNQELTIEPELVVLSTGIVPNNKGLEAFDKLGLEYTPTYFLKEANIKFRPVDMLADGIFIAGLAHSPRQISETIVQAFAAAGRAITILNKPGIPTRRDVSEVNTRKCSGCEACINACPYHARVLDPNEKVAVVLEPLCQACGACAMVCPNGAALMRTFRKGQVYSMIDAAVFS